MNKLAIFVCGGPASGKTTTVNTLRDYFESIDVPTATVDRNGISKRDTVMEHMCLQIYKHLKESSAQVILVDDGGLTVYDREELLKSFDAETDMTKVAIWLNREFWFIRKCNKAEGHRPWSDTALRARNDLNQQPIREEGFDTVFHIAGKADLDITRFVQVLNTNCDMDFAVPGEEDTAECGDTAECAGDCCNAAGEQTVPSES